MTLIICVGFQVAAVAQPGKGYKPIQFDTSYHHTKWGTEPADVLYEFAAFTTSFDSNDDNDGDGRGEAWGIPEWVSYEIKGIPSQSKSGKRPSKWLTDTQGHRDGWVPNDATYAVSGVNSMREVKGEYRYVRGHLCMKNVAERVSLDAAYNTHTTLNAVPQLQWQNAGIWLELEKQTIKWAEDNGRIWVVCGPIFFNKRPAIWLGQEGEVKAAVPDALYKVVIKEVNCKPEAIGFIVPNVLPSEEKDYSKYLTSIRRIEDLTGLSFMANVEGVKIMKGKNEDLSEDERKAVVSEW